MLNLGGNLTVVNYIPLVFSAVTDLKKTPLAMGTWNGTLFCKLNINPMSASEPSSQFAMSCDHHG